MKQKIITRFNIIHILFLLCFIVAPLISCSPDEDDIDISKSHMCGYPTKEDGHPCQRMVADGHRYCWQHR